MSRILIAICGNTGNTWSSSGNLFVVRCFRQQSGAEHTKSKIRNVIPGHRTRRRYLFQPPFQLSPTTSFIAQTSSLAALHYHKFSTTSTQIRENMTGVKLQYPPARRDETLVDNYHGTEVPDPYRWLEDPDAEETVAYVEAQNAITLPFLSEEPAYQTIHDRLEQLWDYPKYSCPARHGDKYYFYKNTGLQNQSVLYVQDELGKDSRVFFDPNTLSSDGTIAISSTAFSEDGSIFAFALSISGSDWNNTSFIDTKTGKQFPEVLEKIKYSSITWTHDNKGIFYACYPDQHGKTDGSETISYQDQKLFYHRVGTPQSEDVLVTEFPEEPLLRIGAQVSDCGNWLIVMPSKDCKDNLVYFTKLGPDVKIEGKLPLTQVVSKLEADYEYVTNDGSKAVFRTNKNAPNFKLITIDLCNYNEENWTDLIPEHSHNVLDWATAVDNDKLVVCYIQDVKNVLEVYSSLTGEHLRNLPIDVGTIVGFSGDKKYSEIFYQFTSFLTPGIIYMNDLKSDEPAKVLREIEVKNFDPSLFTTKQIFYPSKDGTKIPMFIVTKQDAVLDGSMPALLYGYGGFNCSIQPSFSVTRIVFLQLFSGVLAIANIRGGGEYGEKWHSAGSFSNKQNVFDDFQSAAEYLIKNNYTSAKRLTIQGGSNGGTLVAACANQRPDLFGAAIAHVGVMDMLKFHKFTIGYAWVSDYGSSDDPEQFKYLIKYSPLHNVRAPKDGVQYPATLLITADHDDRVVPLHSLKLIATLQHELGNLPQQTNPLLVRIEVNGGHGSGKPTTKMIQESTDVLAFIKRTLNLQLTE